MRSAALRIALELPRRSRLVLLLIASFATASKAQSGWEAAVGLTLPYNIPMPLRILQDGEPDLHLTARYESNPFEHPITWSARVARWSEGSCWGIELSHHKIFLENRPPEVESFAISHGFNLLTLQRGWRLRWVWVRSAAGVVIAHPENTVRGVRLTESGGQLGGGYNLAGPTLGIAAGRPFSIVGGTFASLEAKLEFSHASVPVAAGRARLSHLLLQIGISVGYGPRPPSPP